MKKSGIRVELLLFLIFASVITGMILIKVFILK
ncbi:MAG: hypothetical protein FD166_2567 [Bacteroidetes bacterium]|nr:MAG: hypothetical protein FD166_2567 [Bacteroidota bacterium]